MPNLDSLLQVKKKKKISQIPIRYYTLRSEQCLSLRNEGFTKYELTGMGNEKTRWLITVHSHLSHSLNSKTSIKIMKAFPEQ